MPVTCDSLQTCPWYLGYLLLAVAEPVSFAHLVLTWASECPKETAALLEI